MTKIEVEDSDDIKARSEWSILKSVAQTLIGVSPLVIVLFVWGSSVNERQRVIETRIDHIEATDRRHESDAVEQRREILTRLDRMSNQIEVMQQLLASHSGGVMIRPQGDDPPIKYRNSGSVR